jgi:hypothetical protein
VRSPFPSNTGISLIPQIAGRYYGITEAQVADVVSRCPNCAQKKGIPQAESVHPITSSRPFERLVIDLKDFGSISSEGDPRYCLSMVDHFSSWVFAFKLYSKHTDAVWRKFEKVMYLVGVPDIVHCDNGGEFRWCVSFFHS